MKGLRLGGLALILCCAGCRTVPPGCRLSEPRELERPLGFCVSPGSLGQDAPGMAETGAGWVRLDFKWDRIEREQDIFDFQEQDQLVAAAEAEGLKIIGVLLYDTPWLHPNGKARKYVPPEQIPLFQRFVRETAGRYGTRIAMWEIWNEPNTPHWKGSRKHFFRLYAAGVDALEETLEDPYITTPGIFWGDTGFLRKLFRHVPPERIDAVSFHPYAITPEGSCRQMLKMVRTARKLGFTGDIIISEAGYPTRGLYPSRIAESGQGEAFIRTAAYALASGADLVTWYKYSDTLPRRPHNSEDWFGMTLRGDPDSGGRGLDAFRFLARQINGSRLEPSLSEASGLDGFFHLAFLHRDHLFILFWGQRGTRIIIGSPPGTGHALADRGSPPEPLPSDGRLILTGKTEYLTIPLEPETSAEAVRFSSDPPSR